MYYSQYDSPVGKLLLTCDGESLTGIWMDREPPDGAGTGHPLLTRVEAWLDAYFRGQPAAVDFLLKPEGTDFQKLVWNLLLEIPFGQTRTYGQLAREVADRTGVERMSAQAIGGAVGRNPISIIIPCHRVVGSGGQLTGYAGGLDKKKWLLRHEGADI